MVARATIVPATGRRSSPAVVPPVLMLLAAINQVRRLAVFGLVAAAAIAVVGFVDLGYVRGLALIELGIAGSAALVSAASLTGTYRSATDGDEATTDGTSA